MHNIAEIHEKAIAIARSFRDSEAQLLAVLQQVEEENVYLHQGFPSLFSYAVECLSLSEAVAYNFICVARKARAVPELKEAIARGALSVSKARKITPVLTNENKTEWLEKAVNLSQRDLEREIARAQPRPLPVDRIKYVTGERLELRMGISEEIFEKLKYARDLTSQRSREPATLEATLEAALNCYLEKHDPVRKAQRARKSEPVARQVTEGERPAIPAAVFHAVNTRDGWRCAFVYNGERCRERRFLEIHHKLPLARGGEHSVDNLITLCAKHHKYHHRIPEH